MDPTMFDLIKDHLGTSVPFAAHTGVTLVSVADGAAVATLPDDGPTRNHLATQHAGALFTLAEAASGGAMAGALAPMILEVKPVVSDAQITYRVPARGSITATALTDRAGEDLRAALDADDRVEFRVGVSMRDERDVVVADLDVAWVVSRRR